MPQCCHLKEISHKWHPSFNGWQNILKDGANSNAFAMEFLFFSFFHLLG